MSETLIYYALGSERKGPYTLKQISTFNLSPDTLVWYSGLANWMPISVAPLTSHLYPAQSQPYGADYNQNPYYSQNQYQPPKPDTYLVWAVLTTVLCCLPLGIVSIVYACKVDNLYYRGLYNEAYDASRKAKNWAIWSALTSLILSVLYLFIALAGIAASI